MPTSRAWDVVPRSEAKVAGFFARLEPLESGVVGIEEWRAADGGLEPVKVAVYGAVGRR